VLPQGFLGTRADVLMDVVIVSLVIILPVLAVSWRLALTRRWATHRTVQVALGSGLGVVVLLFEADLRLSGGIFTLTRQSRYAGTALLNTSGNR
jgi:putative membrane protein